MGLFDVFRKTPQERRAEEAHRRAAQEDLEVYSGMRVEVTSGDGRIFLVAKLLDLRGDRARLEPAADGSLLTRLDEPLNVIMRGYSSRTNRAVVLEGTVRVGPNKLWQAEHLALVQRHRRPGPPGCGGPASAGGGPPAGAAGYSVVLPNSADRHP